MSLFDSKGELNAYSQQDALTQIAKLASILQENQPSNFAMAGQPSLNDKQRDEMLAQAIYTQEGKTALAQTMANPIRRNLDYQGVFRRALIVDPLAQGVDAKYERDIDVSAVVVSDNGAVPESRVFGERVTVDTFLILSNPTVRINEVRQRRFNVIDRAVQKARQEIMAQEDANGFAALDAASEIENLAQEITGSGLRKRDLVEIKMQVDHWDNITSKFFMNINEFGDILNWGSGGGTAASDIDVVTQREIMASGVLGRIWGADIIVSKIVPPGTIYGCADPEFLGVMPIRQDIEVIPADEPKLYKLGWVVSEEIGLAIVNPRACAKGVKSTVVS